MIAGGCDCGGVRIGIATAPETVTDCNCSICRRLGVLWSYFEPASVWIEGATVAYLRGAREIEFHHCARCGCTTHWQSAEPASARRMGVNIRLFEPAVLAAAQVRRLDGADSWKYLGED
jgi:hypothetical protein